MRYDDTQQFSTFSNVACAGRNLLETSEMFVARAKSTSRSANDIQTT